MVLKYLTTTAYKDR